MVFLDATSGKFQLVLQHLDSYWVAVKTLKLSYHNGCIGVYIYIYIYGVYIGYIGIKLGFRATILGIYSKEYSLSNILT